MAATEDDFYPAYPPALAPTQESFLKTVTSEWAIAHGLAVRPPQSFTSADPSGLLAAPAPVTLFPSLFPAACFGEALGIQEAYGELYATVASHEGWLSEVVNDLTPIDDFIAELWKVHLSVKAEGYVQDLVLGLFRSDYMVHVDRSATQTKPTIRQVEFNTIASSFGGLSARTGQLHRHLLGTGAYPDEVLSLLKSDRLPPNETIAKLTEGMAAAVQAYGPPRAVADVCILFITQPQERNVFDQKHLEYQLQSAHGLHVFRLAFSDILTQTELTADRTLLFLPPHASKAYEVALVYLRSGYAPAEYEQVPNAWAARLHLERSRAVKCPTVLAQLAGTKKVQQVLATPGSAAAARLMVTDRLRTTFAPMYPLDGATEAGRRGRELALDAATAARFVLKPQREGGGNNVYRGAIPGFLRALPEEKWAAYILMEMIEPPAQRNIIVRAGAVESGSVICELGVFGAVLWRQGGRDGRFGVLHNKRAGYLLRTKGDQSEEGGVAAGFGAIDSVCLVNV